MVNKFGHDKRVWVAAGALLALTAWVAWFVDAQHLLFNGGATSRALGRLSLRIQTADGASLDEVLVALNETARECKLEKVPGAATQTACTIEGLDAGFYDLAVVALDYLAFHQSNVHVNPTARDSSTELQVTLQPEAVLHVPSTGYDLVLDLDGERVGPLPQTVRDLATGEHTVKLSTSSGAELASERVVLHKGTQNYNTYKWARNVALREAAEFGMLDLDHPDMTAPTSSTLAPPSIKAPTIRFDDLRVDGTLSPAAVSTVVHENFASIRECYEAALAVRPDIAGRLQLRFVIGEDGKVTSAANKGASIPSLAMIVCVKEAFENFAFPAPSSGSVQVDYTLRFSAQAAKPR